MAKPKKSEVRDLENLEDIMSLTAEDIRAPANYPVGTWTIRNIGASTSDVTDREGNEQLLINLRYEGFEPSDDVDQDLVEEGGFEGKTLWVKRYISKPAARAARDGTLARFINFVEMHGVDVAGLDLEGMVKALRGAMIRGSVGVRTYTNRDGDEVTDNTVTGFAPAE